MFDTVSEGSLENLAEMREEENTKIFYKSTAVEKGTTQERGNGVEIKFNSSIKNTHLDL